jgi:hypothetical protein
MNMALQHTPSFATRLLDAGHDIRTFEAFEMAKHRQVPAGRLR